MKNEIEKITFILSPNDVLLLKLRDFKKRKSFNLAQNIWLFCHDHNFETPKNILEEFIKGLRKQDKKYTQNKTKKWHAKNYSKGVKAVIVLHIDHLLKSGECKNGADAIKDYIQYHKSHYKEHIESDAVRQTYYRMGGRMLKE